MLVPAGFCAWGKGKSGDTGTVVINQLAGAGCGSGQWSLVASEGADWLPWSTVLRFQFNLNFDKHQHVFTSVDDILVQTCGVNMCCPCGYGMVQFAGIRMLVPDLTVCCQADHIIIVMMTPTGLRAWRDAKMAHPRLGRIHQFSYVGFGFPDWRGIFRQGLTDGGRWIVWQSFIGSFDSRPKLLRYPSCANVKRNLQSLGPLHISLVLR
jgi:hypothetical protein